ncbi:MAG: glycosyltransferase family 1 protein [Rhizobiaceae bacterium]
MRIAVDGRNLVGAATGIARYIRMVCNCLQLRGHEIIVLTPSAVRADWPGREKMRFETSTYEGPPARQYWANFVLPEKLGAVGADAFWGPAHRLPRRRLNLPSLVTIHDLVWRTHPQTMRATGYWSDRLLMPRAVANATLVCANSASTASETEQAFALKPGSVRVVHPCVETDESAVTGARRPDRFLFVGTNEPRKNLDGLMKALSLIKVSQAKPASLLVIGATGWKSRPVMEMADRHGVADRVEAAGFVSDETLEEAYRGSVALVVPSWHEGFGLPIIEAQKYGVPVIVSDLPVFHEVAGEGALYINPADPGSIANAMQQLASDTGLRANLSSGALRNSSRFTALKTGRAMEAAIADAIALYRDGYRT